MSRSILHGGLWRRVRHTGILGVLAAVVLTLVASIAPQSVYPTPLPGNDYIELGKRALPVAPDGKIHVTEIFWYGCPYCQQFEPAFREWTKSLGDRVEVDRVPAAVQGLLVPGAKAYFTLQDLGVLAAYHDALLLASQAGTVDPTDDRSILDWFAKQGIDPQLVESTYNSTRVAHQVEDARKLVTSLAIDTIPSIVVNGSYLTSTQMAGGYQKEIDVLNYLVTLPVAAPRAEGAAADQAAAGSTATSGTNPASTNAPQSDCGCSAR